MPGVPPALSHSMTMQLGCSSCFTALWFSWARAFLPFQLSLWCCSCVFGHCCWLFLPLHCLLPGEVFVLNDGGEVDLDLGNYERFLDINLYKDNNITTGKIYQHVINKERHGDYLGRTVQGELPAAGGSSSLQPAAGTGCSLLCHLFLPPSQQTWAHCCLASEKGATAQRQ